MNRKTSVLVVSIVFCMSILIISTFDINKTIAESSSQTTELDFNAGILENTEIVGTGLDAYLRLKLEEDGSLVTGFDYDGIIESNPSALGDIARSIAMDTNYIYIAGYAGSPSEFQWRVEKRDKVTGALVITFDLDGVVESNPSMLADYAYSIAVDSSYIYIAGSDASPANLQWRVEKRDKATGALVTAFDTDGVVESNPSSGSDAAYSIAVDSRYIYIAGYDALSSDHQWRIEKRDKTTGALVTAFDTDGVVTSDPSTSHDDAYSIAIDMYYIYVAGYDYSPTNYQWRIEKRDKETGALVTTFNSTGVVKSNPSTGIDQAYSITVDLNYIYVAGTDNSGTDVQWRVEKRDKTTGALISDFDSDGVVQSNPSVGGDYAYSITVDPSFLYVVGYDYSQGDNQWRVEKRDKTTGALVTSFDTDGVVESNPSTGITGNDRAYSLAVDSSHIYVTGYDQSQGNLQWRVEKLDISTGANASGFNLTGVVLSDPSSGFDSPQTIAVDSNYIYVAGYDLSPGLNQWRIEKRDKITGVLVMGFNSTGVVESNPSIYSDYAYSIAVDPSFIYIAGSDNSKGASDTQWRVEKRDKTTGALVTVFDTDGVVESNPSSGTDTAQSIVVDSSYIYVAGYDSTNTNHQWRVEKRDKTTGALVPAFDTDGVVESNPSSSNDYARAMTIDSDYIYVTGYDYSQGNAQWRVEKRDKTTGALVTAFDTDGVVESNPSIDDRAYSITVDSSYVYIAGYDRSTDNGQWRIEKRDKTTGALITEFNSTGVVQSNPSSNSDIIYSITVDSNNIYVGGSDYSQGNLQWRVEKRDKITGALVTAFDSDGVLHRDRGEVYSIAIDSSYIYATGSDYSQGNAQWRIEKYMNRVFPHEGYFTSSLIDTGGLDDIVWSTISWTSEVLPPETMVKFQLAACNDGVTWEYLGPDGTEYTYYETAAGQLIWPGLSGKYLRYQAYFSTTDSGFTPELFNVQVNFIEVKPPVVQLTSPNGGEDWMKGKYYPITWEADGELDDESVDLYFSLDNGETWKPIAMWLPNRGHFNWTVPNNETPNALIKIEVTDIFSNMVSDTSDASFAIDPPPEKYVPPGGDGGSSKVPREEDGSPGTTAADDSKESKINGLDPGLMVGAVSILIIVIIILTVTIFFLVKSKRPKKQEKQKINQELKSKIPIKKLNKIRGR